MNSNELNEAISIFQAAGRKLKAQAALFSDMANEIESEAEAVFSILDRCRAPNADYAALNDELTALHQRFRARAARWPQFVEAFNRLEKGS